LAITPQIQSKALAQNAPVTRQHCCKKFKGDLISGYALLGQHDLVLIAELPDTEHAIKASVELSKLTGIAFTTSPAVAVEDFDKLIGN
jgi:uncharacterized protein with GYD domain